MCDKRVSVWCLGSFDVQSNSSTASHTHVTVIPMLVVPNLKHTEEQNIYTSFPILSSTKRIVRAGPTGYREAVILPRQLSALRCRRWRKWRSDLRHSLSDRCSDVAMQWNERVRTLKCEKTEVWSWLQEKGGIWHTARDKRGNTKWMTSPTELLDGVFKALHKRPHTLPALFNMSFWGILK